MKPKMDPCCLVLANQVIYKKTEPKKINDCNYVYCRQN